MHLSDLPKDTRVPFVVCVALVLLTFFLPGVVLWLEFYGRRVSRALGSAARAFRVHGVVTVALWVLSFAAFGWLQGDLGEHPDLFDGSSAVQWRVLQFGLGGVLLLGGLLLATLAFALLGLRNSLHWNFFAAPEEAPPVLRHWLFSVFKHPEEFGFWAMMAGYALLTRSVPNALVALVFVLAMVPYMYVENLPLHSAHHRQLLGDEQARPTDSLLHA